MTNGEWQEATFKKAVFKDRIIIRMSRFSVFQLTKWAVMFMKTFSKRHVAFYLRAKSRPMRITMEILEDDPK